MRSRITTVPQASAGVGPGVGVGESLGVAVGDGVGVLSGLVDAIRKPADLPWSMHLRRAAGAYGRQLGQVFLALAFLLGLDPFSIVAATICAAVPTAKTVYILAAQYDTDRELVATTIAVTTVGSVVTLFAWLTLMAQILPGGFPH